MQVGYFWCQGCFSRGGLTFLCEFSLNHRVAVGTTQADAGKLREQIVGGNDLEKEDLLRAAQLMS